MGIEYSCDIIEKLKLSGYNTTRIKREKVISEPVLQKYRTGELVTLRQLEIVCRLCNCQPSDLIRFVKDEEPETE